MTARVAFRCAAGKAGSASTASGVSCKLGYGLTPYDDVKGFTDHQGSNNFENPNNGVSSGPGFAANGLFKNYGVGGNDLWRVTTFPSLATSTNNGAFDARYSNSISYLSPNLGRF